MTKKGPVEYTFRNSLKEEVTTAILTNYNLIIRKGGKEVSYPYPTITMVRLYKLDNLFKIVLYPDGKTPITVSNKFYTVSGKEQDQSRAYNTWVRILHFHMKDKSTAHYVFGMNVYNALLWLPGVVFVCFVISFLSDYFNVVKLNGWATGAMLSLLILAGTFVFYFNKLPKDYRPESIPLEFLPGD